MGGQKVGQHLGRKQLHRSARVLIPHMAEVDLQRGVLERTHEVDEARDILPDLVRVPTQTLPFSIWSSKFDSLILLIDLS